MTVRMNVGTAAPTPPPASPGPGRSGPSHPGRHRRWAAVLDAGRGTVWFGLARTGNVIVYVNPVVTLPNRLGEADVSRILEGASTSWSPASGVRDPPDRRADVTRASRWSMLVSRKAAKGETLRLADVSESRVVLMGVGSFDGDGLADLPSVPAGVDALRRAFTDPGVWGLRPDHCAVMPEDSEVRHALGMVRVAAREATDLLLIYYAGHGLTTTRGDLLLALRGTVRGEAETALPYHYLREVVIDSRAARKVVILDCCYSGRALLGWMSADGLAAHAAIDDSTYLLTSSAETEISLAPEGERFTAFTGELVAVLTRGIPGAGVLLTTDDLYRGIYRALHGKARPTPQQRTRNDGAAIAIVRNKAATLTADDQADRHLPRAWAELAAERGDTAAMLGLAYYYTGSGETARALAWWQRAAEGGSILGMNNLAHLLAGSGKHGASEAWYRRAAEGGDTDAMNNLGVGLDQRGEPAEAERWYRRAAEGGNTVGMRYLGIRLAHRGEPVEAEQWFRRAAEGGYTDAMNNLGVLLEERGELAEAQEWFQRAAEGGNTLGMGLLGQLAERRGELDVARRWYLSSADGGNTDVLLSLGLLAERLGKPHEAEPWYRRAAESGQTSGMVNLGIRLQERGLTEEAEAWFRRAAENGNTAAMNTLGVRLHQRDKAEEAERWYRRSAEGGDSGGMTLLGIRLVERGEFEEAEGWYRRAADRGNTSSMHNLGSLAHERGEWDAAEAWYRRASEAGDQFAMNDLGVLLLQCERIEEAEAWFRHAAEAGNTDAMGNLAIVLEHRGETEEAETWRCRLGA